MKNWKGKTLGLQCKVLAKWQSFWNDCSGSDLTEKMIGILAAALIGAMLITALKTFMPGLFESIFEKAKNIIMADSNAPNTPVVS